MVKKISVAIVTHPKRRHLIPSLKRQLGDVIVCEDGNNNLLENHRRAWNTFDKEANYHLVIEDDAILCANFNERLYKMIDDFPNPIYVLYWHSYNTIRSAEVFKQGFCRGTDINKFPVTGLATCMSTKIILDMLNWTENMENMPIKSELDTRIMEYAKTKQIMIHYPIPCLVEHGSEESLNVELEMKLAAKGKILPPPSVRKAGKYFIDYKGD